MSDRPSLAAADVNPAARSAAEAGLSHTLARRSGVLASGAPARGSAGAANEAAPALNQVPWAFLVPNRQISSASLS